MRRDSRLTRALKTVSTAAWTSREIFIAYCKANNAAAMQQNFARSDKALSAGT